VKKKWSSGQSEMNRSIIRLRIDAITVPNSGGLIGMSICPGKYENAGLCILASLWKRDMDLDLQEIRNSRPDALVTLVEKFQFELLCLPELHDKAC
jgi:hypothetical protein